MSSQKRGLVAVSKSLVCCDGLGLARDWAHPGWREFARHGRRSMTYKFPPKRLDNVSAGRASVLFHHSEREMGCSRCLKCSCVFQVDRGSAEVIEEANALTQEYMGNGHMEFVEQTRLQGLLDGACTMKGN